MMAGTLLAALSVILGAFGAHALKTIVAADQLLVFETAVKYQFYHCFALLAAGIAYSHYPSKLLKQATNLFIAGVACFSGSLYAMVALSTSGISLGPVGILTPIGGLLLIIGWVLFFAGIAKGK